jgi:hypothetical protein
MIIQCSDCKKHYDDEFRWTQCPHNTFAANDGHNNFKHYSASWLGDKPPSKVYKKMLDNKKLNKFLNGNKVNI